MAGGATVLRLPVRYQGRSAGAPERVVPPPRHGRPAAALGHRAGRLRLTRRGWVALAVAGLSVATALLLVGVWLGAHFDGGLG